MEVAKNVIFCTTLHWPIRMWHPHLASNVKRRSANQKMFRLCSLGVILNVHNFKICTVVHMLCGLTDRFEVSMKINQQ